MTYWLLTSEYPPFFGGGIGTYCAMTARMLADKGHQVSVFINDASVRDIKITEERGIRLIQFNTTRTDSSDFLGHVTNISYEFAHILKHFIEKEGKPDCIEAQEYLGIAYYLLQYKHLLYDWCRDIPVLITMHSPSSLYMEYNQVPMYRYPNYWICEMERFCLQAADQIISPSKYMLQELGKRFELHNKRVSVIPNPFDGKLNNIVPITDAPVANEIVFFGKLTAQKGAFRLLAYFQALWEQGFQRPLFLLGGQDIVYHPEGITMGDIIRKKYKVYIDKGLLRLEDKIKPSEIAARLAKAELVIVPSDNDNLPYVVFEMMALGKILLVSKQGGQSEVITHEVDGFIFDHKETGSFSRELNKILNLDPQQRVDIAANAIWKVTDIYGPEQVYRQKIEVLQTLISANKNESVVFPYIRQRVTGKIAVDKAEIQGKVCVVVPYFNMGAYIGETIRSIQLSVYVNKEIIIVNDGSTEEHSIQQLNQYRNQEGIRVIDVSNGGLAKARNLGAQKADGEFLAFLDADDTVAPTYYLRTIRVLQQYLNVHFAGAWVRYFGNSDKIWPAFMPEPPLILYHNLVNSSSLVYKRQAFLAGGINDDQMAFPGLEDYDSVLSMLTKGFGGVVIPEPLFNYRIRKDSMIRGISRHKKLFLMQYISHKHAAFYNNFSAELFNLLNANGPGISQDNPSADHHLADRIPFGGKLSAGLITLVKRNRFAKTMAYKLYKLLKK